VPDETTFLLRHWLNGGSSALAAVTSLMKEDRGMAASVARLALRRDPESPDRSALLAILGEIGSTPAGWDEALEEFAADPSEDAWDALIRFIPEENLHQRLKYTIAMLQSLGCNGDLLFRCASRLGMLPELFDLAASGTVDPETIVARAQNSSASAAWLGLAAQAAFARGDRDATIRHLWTASQSPSAFLAFPSVSEIRQAADAELNEALDRMGVMGTTHASDEE
jgi:hypothetical protein